MKLHKDGTVEGTPEEIAEYNRLVNNMAPRLCNWPPYTIKPVITSTSGGSVRSDGKGITAWNEMTRDIVELQKDYWKENLTKSLEEMEKRTGLLKSEILLYAIKGTNLE